MAPVKTTTTRYGRTSKAVQEPSVGTTREKRIKLYEPEPERVPTGGRSTRASRRSGIVGDQWEPIPDEWLNPDAVGKATNGKGKGKKGQKPSLEEESELSELSDVGGEEESDLTSISSSGLSDMEGDEVTAPEAQSPGPGLETANPDGQRNKESTDDVPGQTENIDISPINGPEEGAAMDVDKPETDPSSTNQPTLDVTAVAWHAPSNTVDNLTPDISIPGQDRSMVPDVTADEQVATAEQHGADVSMNVVAPEVADQAAGRNGVVEEHTRQAEGPAESEVVTVAEEEPVLSKPEPEPTMPLPQETVTDVPMADAVPEQPTNGDEAKTVLQELSEEVTEALEEEEDDPNDEVRAIIKRARNPDYLEWELVSRFAFFIIRRL
jgi:hypothetical protein